MTDLYSEKYRKFLEILQDDYTTLFDLADRVGEAFCYIADEIKLGRACVDYFSPGTPVEEPIHEKREIFEADQGYEDEELRLEYAAKTGATSVFSYYPVKGSHFDDEDKETLQFINKSVTAHCGRVHVMDLMWKGRFIDPLTRIPNFPGLQEKMKSLFEQGKFSGYAVIFTNIRNFNYYNQQMGVPVGDSIMKLYAETVSSYLKPESTVGRVGGDNFVTVITKPELEDYLSKIARIEIRVRAVAGIERTVNVETRSGVYLVQEGKTFSDAMNGSNVALENAKKYNKKRLDFSPKMLEVSGRERLIIAAFPNALKTGQFEAYYQPKVSLIHKNIVGAEALVRWNRDGNIMVPKSFVPALERQGAIKPLDFQMLTMVCKDINRWIAEGIEPVRVSVNFSKMHLRDENLANDIIKVVKDHGVDPKYIEIELTETTGYEEMDEMKNFIRILRDNGIYTSLDDFGTGYSSLNLLTDFPVKVIKIDKSFVDNINKEGAPDRMIISAILKLLDELEMEVIAEGVETPDQARTLLNMNCYNVQGFLFDKPLRGDIFMDKLKQKDTFKYQVEF
ncbi:MAG: EAL domain-containing protein [Lachnospiraceae bacterium]|nr:EAL domain-containing protein [Lachnospiraceae bacterium]